MKYPLQYAMYPLLPGDVQLPRLHVNMLRYPGTMDEIVQKMLVSHVYVKVTSFSRWLFRGTQAHLHSCFRACCTVDICLLFSQVAKKMASS